MHVIEDQENDYTWYSEEMRSRVAMIFDLAAQMSELRNVLEQIKAEAKSLRQLFFSDEEQKEMQALSSGFDLEMRRTKQSILNNLMTYRQFGWSKIFDEGKRE
ncbi:hypothetical protein ACS3UN_09605 [Oscillospiraceae bacterium LTW-04]|nr:hypothetical protein RBH76_11365 [Oscillospiraceae bacterium MB24-C1]